MRSYSLEEIRSCFGTSTDFNEIFDVFQSALSQKVKDIEAYRLLFWNPSLTADEVRLFGEKAAGEFPDLAFDLYLWMASVFEVTCSSRDNFELALQYYQRAADVRPAEVEPYLEACDCYDPDLNIPPLTTLVEFVERGVGHVSTPGVLYARLAEVCELAGDAERGAHYRRRAEEGGPTVGDQPAP